MFIRVKFSDNGQIWINGTISPLGWTFEAKVYEEPSSFGIDGGKISKLFSRKSSGEDVFTYDRGWVKIPKTTLQIMVYKAILKALAKIE
jgi:hypothetical protein